MFCPQRRTDADPIRPRKHAAPRCSRPALRASALLAGCCALVGWPRISFGQVEPAAKPSFQLADAVPASAGLFVELDRLVKEPDQARAGSALRFYELITGSAPRQPGLAPPWRKALLQALGIKTDREAETLLAHHLAIAAPSWSKLSEGILVVRLQGQDTLLEDVFQPDSADTIDGRDRVIVYRTRGTLSAATNGDILVVSARRATASLYDQATKLMLGRPVPRLSDLPEFRGALETLPSTRDGLIYLARESLDAAERVGLPAMTSGVASIRFHADRVDVQIAATARQAPPTSSTEAAAQLQQLRQLPQTTVGAWCTSVDVDALFSRVLAVPLAGDSAAYLESLTAVLDAAQVHRDLVKNLGPGAVVAWDQDVGRTTGFPRLALLLEAKDPAAATADAVADAAQVVVDWFDLQHRDHGGPHLSRSSYLGSTVHEIVIPWTAPAAPSETRNLHLAFTATAERFVLSTSADQVRNILDASIGLAPRLGDLPDWQLLNLQGQALETVAVAQPAFASQILDEWLADPHGWMRTWLGDARSGVSPASGPPRVGIGTKPGTEPGTVLIARVYPGTRAAGLLLPDDQILGINGGLLGLTDAVADLRAGVSVPPKNGVWSFRVRRGDDLLDVDVPASPAVEVSAGPADPAEALRQLQELCSSVEFVAVTATHSAPDRVSASLVLRFNTREPPP